MAYHKPKHGLQRLCQEAKSSNTTCNTYIITASDHKHYRLAPSDPYDAELYWNMPGDYKIAQQGLSTTQQTRGEQREYPHFSKDPTDSSNNLTNISEED